MNILVTGSSSGLGKEFVRQLTESISSTHAPGVTTIYAIDRTNPPLNTLSPPSPTPTSNVRHIPISLDITSPSDVQAFFNTTLKSIPIHLVIHSAGQRGLVDGGKRVTNYADVKTSENLEVMDAETMRATWEVNVLGAFEVFRGCIDGLRMAGTHSSDSETTVNGQVNGETPKADSSPKKPDPGLTNIKMPMVIVMGSRMGSIGHNSTHPQPTNSTTSSNNPKPSTNTNPANTTAGGAYAYRTTKAALNALVRSFAIDVPDAIWTIIHPGRVETGLVQVKEDGAMSVQESVRDMLALMGRLGREESGRFLDRFGAEIPW
jgi:NAD(P)-dependent dehydrogenase (short-subunit alcohol dehydrogenase family)